jgi:large subunit ribosomal protein L15e
MRKSFENTISKRTPLLKERLTKWRQQPVVTRLEGPTNIPAARRLGYKAVRNTIVARVRLSKGRRVRDRPAIGRKPGRNLKRVSPGQPKAILARNKAQKRFPNLKPIGSYFVGMDGTDEYFEVILVK